MHKDIFFALVAPQGAVLEVLRIGYSYQCMIAKRLHLRRKGQITDPRWTIYLDDLDLSGQIDSGLYDPARVAG